ncbi:MAG: histidine phosphatase family protein [Clostridiales bacterium]|nr:histidine phosphatase family protein [Clostridiales bacterium]
MNIIAVILAGGYSSRMGSFKPLLELGGIPALSRICAAFSSLGLPLCVVTGHNAEALRPLLAEAGAAEAYNPDFAGGMFTSIRAGVLHARNTGADGLLLCPVDCSLVSPDSVRLVLDTAEAFPDRFSVACFGGKKGHPLYIPAKVFDEIIAHDGTNGLKGVTRRYNGELIRIETLDEGVLLDMDTSESYEHMKNYLAGRVPRLAELLPERRFLLARHGSTRPHREKTFIGRHDVPLSEKGREEARGAAELIKSLSPNCGRVYCSDLSRSIDSAEAIAAALGLKISPDPRLSELSLGEWDGCAISEIKRRFPAEYEERGRDILGYKTPGGENFYELQYRVAQCLTELLAADPSPDIVICAHKGVIQSILGLLGRKSPDFSAQTPAKGEVIVTRYTPI